MAANVDDIYSGFDNPVEQVDQTPARTGTPSRLLTGRGGTALPHGRLGTGTNRGRNSTGLRTGTGGGVAVEGRRPVTAVKAAGYVSSKGPTWRAGSSSSGFLSRSKMSSLAEVCKATELEVHALIEEAAELLRQKQADQGHDIAQKALAKVEELQQQYGVAGVQDNAIVDLQFAVRICLAQCAQEAGMDQEALTLFTGIAKNSEFQMAGRIRVNIGNIFAKRGNWTEAIKQYRMALDQIPTERQLSGGQSALQGNESGPYASMQCRLLRNIGVAFLHQGMYADARDNFEAVLCVKPDVTSAYNRLIAVFMVTKSVEQSDCLKAAFRDMLGVPQLNNAGIDSSTVDDYMPVDGQLDTRMNRNSQLVLTAAKLIAPRLQPGDPEAGFQWCLDELTKVKLVRLTHDVMMAKASYFLNIAAIEQAAQVLKQFEKHGGSMRVKAATNLSFLYLLEGNVQEAQRYANLALSHDEFHVQVCVVGDYKSLATTESHVKTMEVQALVNSGNCCFALAMAEDGQPEEKLSEAWALYEAALRQEPDCVEAIYNMGLVAKAMEQYDLALEQLIMLNGMIANQVEVLHQIADLYLLKGDNKRARKMLHLTYDFVGSEPGIMARLGTMCAEASNRDESLRYLLEAHEQCPNLDTLAVICAQYVNDEKYEAAAGLFQQAALLQPGDPKWALMVASCHRRAQKHELALEMYEKVHEQHPNNVEAIKFMVQLAGDLEDESKRVAYEAALIRVERILAMQDHVPKPSSKHTTDRPPISSPGTSQTERAERTLPLPVADHWDQSDCLPLQVVATPLSKPHTTAGIDQTSDVLGEDLLPGLGDM